MKQHFKIIPVLIFAVFIAACTHTAVTGEMPAEISEPVDQTYEVIPLFDTENFSYDQLPLFSSEPYVTVNDNHPYDPISSVSEFIRVSQLDELGRCGGVEAVIGPDTLPSDQRTSIGTYRPSGWQTVRYDDLIDGHYLYNRCHLIAYEIGGINADEEILVTGTRYMNIEGMLPFENRVASYVRNTGNHVYYHATPVFIDDELVCRGILLEAASIENDDLEFCVFCYNVQPGITISYTDGSSEREEQTASRTIPLTEESQEYILNTNTKKFHYPYCDSVRAMKDKNKQTVFTTRSALIEEGYDPCAVCNP